MSIPENLQRIESRIADACARSGRRREEIALVAISKTFPASAVEEAIAAGVTDVGENRVQELRKKVDEVRASVRWHLVGHLQSNKAKEAARISTMIQSIDSRSLAEKIAHAAEKPIEVLVQVNIGAEEQKSGVAPEEALQLAEEIVTIDGLDLRGLMTIPPIATPDETRTYFQKMRRLREQLEARVGAAHAGVLSMGMSDDFEIAIEEGSTMIRVGRAIFGERESH